MADIRDLLNAAVTKDKIEFDSAFDSIMAAKVGARLQERFVAEEESEDEEVVTEDEDLDVAVDEDEELE